MVGSLKRLFSSKARRARKAQAKQAQSPQPREPPDVDIGYVGAFPAERISIGPSTDGGRADDDFSEPAVYPSARQDENVPANGYMNGQQRQEDLGLSKLQISGNGRPPKPRGPRGSPGGPPAGQQPFPPGKRGPLGDPTWAVDLDDPSFRSRDQRRQVEATPQLPRPQMGVSSLEARQASHGQASTNPGLPTGRGLTQPNRVDSLATGVVGLAKQVIESRNRGEKAQAVLKLFATLGQAKWVTQQGLMEEWTAIYLGILQAGLARFVKHTAAIVVRADKGFVELVRAMAAGVLKTLAVWVEKEIAGVEGQPDRQQTVVQALEEMLIHSSRSAAQNGGNPDHDIMGPGGTYQEGGGSILDTSALEGMLDDQAFGSYQDARGAFGRGVMDSGVLGSLMDTNSLEAMMQQGRPGGRRVVPVGGARAGANGRSGGAGIMDTNMMSTHGSMMGTQDLQGGQLLQYKGTLRALIWLFKADQPDGWYAAASFLGSLASLGLPKIEALGGPKLVRPLMWLLRHGDASCKFAAVRALMFLADEPACRHAMSSQDRDLRELARALQQPPAESQWAAATTLVILLVDDPSTHWVLTQAGIIAGLVRVLGNPLAPPGVKADVTLGLKHLTASSQRNRDSFMACGGLQFLVPQLAADSAEAQYNSARILRHLALGSNPQHKAAALIAVEPLVGAIKTARPRVCFAAAAALAMLTEGHPEICAHIEACGGIQALVGLLCTGGGQGKKSAAEALQAMAAEHEAVKPRLASAGAIRPLVQMVKDGNLQQQAAAAGAIQALAYCPTMGPAFARTIASNGAIFPLVDMLCRGPIAMRCAAAGALCNLSLGCPDNQRAITRAGAISSLVTLMHTAQPDGQYSAAATLYNCAQCGPDVRTHLGDAGIVDVLCAMLDADSCDTQQLMAGGINGRCAMLEADSWYCRIVAAEVLSFLIPIQARHPALASLALLQPLMRLITIYHEPGRAEEAASHVAHLAYERNDDVIVMKGFKFARGRIPAAACLASLALANHQAAMLITQEDAVLEQLVLMLSSGNGLARTAAAAALSDLAVVNGPCAECIIKVGGVKALADMLNRAAGPSATSIAQANDDCLYSVKALSAIVASCPEAVPLLVDARAITGLIEIVQRRGPEPAAAAARLLQALAEAGPEHARELLAAHTALVQYAQQQVRSAASLAGASQALVRARMAQEYSGFAITAKPSANLYVLLQVPFDALMPSETAYPARDSLAADRERLQMWRDAVPEPGQPDGSRQRVQRMLQRAADGAVPDLPPRPPSKGSQGPRRPRMLDVPSQRDILETWLEY